MKWNIAKPFILLFTLYFCRWLLMRGEPKEEEVWDESREEIEGREIAAVQFRATVKMGIRRKTMIIGQIYEYLRLRGRIWSHFVDQEGNVEVKVVEMKDNITHQRNFYLIMKFIIHDSFQLEYKNRDVENMNKCGSKSCAILSLKIEPNEFVSTSTIFEMKIMNKIGKIEIENRTFLVESTVKIDLKYKSNSRSIDEVSKIYVYIAELTTNIEKDSTLEIIIEPIISRFPLLFIIFSIILNSLLAIKMMENSKSSNLSELNINLNGVDLLLSYFKGIFIGVLFIPINYFVYAMLFELIYEFCPLGVNEFYYHIANFIFTIINIMLINLKDHCNTKIRDFLEPDDMKYICYIINSYLLYFAAYFVLPEHISVSLLCLNFRLYLCLFSPIVSILVVINVVSKSRSQFTNNINQLIILLDLICYVVLKYPWHLIVNCQINFTLVCAIILLISALTINKLQKEWGSRFFLPNKCRTKAFEYRRRIADDFGLTKIDEDICIECDLCLQDLNFPSLLSDNRSLSKMEGKECYSVYMKTKTGLKLHYFCLLRMIERNRGTNDALVELDQYDD